MNEFGAGLVLGLAAAGLGSMLLGRRAGRRPEPVAGDGEPTGQSSTHLLPEPALDWLLRANGALGVWISELDPHGEGPRAERWVDAERLSVKEIAAVDRRLERARDETQSGVETVAPGLLIFRSAAGVAVAMLLPPGDDPGRSAQAERDLDRLLHGIRRRPQAVALAQAHSREVAVESVGSVGMRLAYQLERSLGAETVVAAAEPAGVRVVGVSARGDRRLLDVMLPPDAQLARVAAGAIGQTLVAGDSLGGAVPDRRLRHGPLLLVPITAGGTAVGAVSIHLPTGAEPAGPARAELVEALLDAGPRLARAVEGDQAERAAQADPLTSLQNRRGLEAAMRSADAARGALILAQLDRVQELSEALGQLAGDAALVHFARIIREQVRGQDTPARLGAEDFAVWLPDGSLELGMRIAERIRIKLATTAWDWRGRPWPLSASFGVAACPETTPSVGNLVAQAGAALLVAQRSGRDRVETAGSPAV